MSSTELSIHNVTKIEVEAKEAHDTKWYYVDVYDINGEHVKITLFVKEPVVLEVDPFIEVKQ